MRVLTSQAVVAIALAAGFVAALAGPSASAAVTTGRAPSGQTAGTQLSGGSPLGTSASNLGPPTGLDPAGAAGFHVLWGVAATTPTDALAVGEGGADLSVRARHWDGTHWVPTQPPGGPISEMFGVAAITPTDAWGVGDAGNLALAEHWDGTTWTQTQTPPPDQYTRDIFHAVSGISSDDVWAVGETESGKSGGVVPLIEHWNGRTWKKVPFRPPPGNSEGYFSGIAAITPDDVWAVGSFGPDGPLIEHWDGTRWNPATGVINRNRVHGAVLRAVTGVSADNVWAVGAGLGGTAILHWNGHAWTRMPSPNGPQPLNQLFGVTAVSTDDVWAVGTSGPFGQMTGRTLILHWDGHRWTKVASPNPGRTNNGLYGVSATTHHDVWAVGALSNNLEDSYVHLYLHWDGTAWTRQRA